MKPIAASKSRLRALAALSVVTGANAHAARPGAPSGQFYMGVAAHLSNIRISIMEEERLHLAMV